MSQLGIHLCVCVLRRIAVCAEKQSQFLETLLTYWQPFPDFAAENDGCPSPAESFGRLCVRISVNCIMPVYCTWRPQPELSGLIDKGLGSDGSRSPHYS